MIGHVSLKSIRETFSKATSISALFTCTLEYCTAIPKGLVKETWRESALKKGVEWG